MLATLLLVAAVGGPWSYAGMLANPEPARPKSEASPPSPPPSAPPATVRQAEARSPATRPAELAARQVAPPPPPPQTMWRVADASGQVWEHTDPAALSAFVRQRNARFYPPLYTAPAYQVRAGRCGPSGCR